MRSSRRTPSTSCESASANVQKSLLFQAAFPDILGRELASEGKSEACVLRGLGAAWLDSGVEVLAILGGSECPGAWWNHVGEP